MNESKPMLKARKEVEINLSPIWFLPILAVIISVWLLVKLNLESKIPITIEMSSAQGIVPGKTQLKFRGISAGTVSRIEFAEELDFVTIHAEIDPDLSEYLTTETKFWVVRAQISLAGVSGLDTVLSGDYIAFAPGKSGDPKRAFKALNSAPPISNDDPGIRITLTADNLGSVSEGSQLYYRQIPIGEVRFFELSEDTRSVNISALIEPEYSDLVNESTVFWNTGGIRVKGSLSGFEVQTESLSAILAGGISLFTPNPEAATIDMDTNFVLHESYDDAGVGVPIKIAFPSGYDLKSGITQVKFHGINVGHLDSINVSPDDDSGVIANIIIDPGAEPLLVEDTQFWLVKPDLSFRSLSNLETLISGNFITLKSGDSMVPARSYVALDGPPPPDFQDPGLHLVLKSNQIGSIELDTPVLFKGVEVGRVANVYINDLTEGVSFHIHIRPQFANLINATSRFWNASGLDISAGLGGIQVRSGSIMNILRGGIEFETLDPNAAVVDDGHEFRLLDNPLTSENPLKVTISIPDASGYQPNVTSIRYKGMGVGVLKRLQYRQATNDFLAHFEMNQSFAPLIRETTQFWLVTPKLGAAKIEGLDTLFTGPYITFRAGEGAARDTFTLMPRPAAKIIGEPGLVVELQTAEAGGIQVGSPVTHRQIEVGTVESVELKDNGVAILIHIQPDYTDFVSSASRFWNASRLRVKASLSGIDVSTSSLPSVLSGGVAFDTLTTEQDRPVQPGTRFKLYGSEQTALRDSATISILDTRASGVQVGATVRYHGLRIGEVTSQELNDEDQISLNVAIDNSYTDLLNNGSVFWLAKPKLGLVEQKNLAQLISGPEIRVSRGSGEPSKEFKLSYQEPVTKRLDSGLNLVLESARLGSVKEGNGVYYRQLQIGQVIGVQLSQTADKVAIFINIDEPFTAIIRSNSVFWNASGMQISAGIFSGVDIKTESVESILAGGIAVATPEDLGELASQNQRFRLRGEFDDDWLDWSPEIPLNLD